VGRLPRSGTVVLNRRQREGKVMNEFRSQSGSSKDLSKEVSRDARAVTVKDGAVASRDLITAIDARLDRRKFQEHHWTGAFWDYLEIAAHFLGLPGDRGPEPGGGAERVPAAI